MCLPALCLSAAPCVFLFLVFLLLHIPVPISPGVSTSSHQRSVFSLCIFTPLVSRYYLSNHPSTAFMDWSAFHISQRKSLLPRQHFCLFCKINHYYFTPESSCSLPALGFNITTRSYSSTYSYHFLLQNRQDSFNYLQYVALN